MIDKTQLQTLCEIALAAGREVMEVYGTDFSHVQKDDNSPLTQADLRSDKVIRDGLERAFAGVFILSEESSPQASGSHERFFLVDPLDGTKEFLKRNDEFTVNIALVEGGVPIAGVVYAPALAELYFGAQGQGAWKSKEGAAPVQLRTNAPRAAAPLRVIGSRSHGGEELARWLQQLVVEHTFVAAGSSLKFCRLAEGAADVYPRLGPTSQWDTAAAQAVLECAGGAVLEASGADLRYGLQRPILNPYFIALADRHMSVPPIASR
ncbi:MAG TPA: 3'(2'),5'-bisphosphate nucleotidase CysQ [Ramlibacter sp.]|nr:3'(2'),5'-bisphosphate nucleotidase CysQ [Ramlibacter sp.]